MSLGGIGADRHDGGWRRGKRAAIALLASVVLVAFSAPAAEPPRTESVSVIVRELPGGGDQPERSVERLGGVVVAHLGIIDGFSARLPAGSVERLRDAPGVHSVTPDGRVQLTGFDKEVRNNDQSGSMYAVAETVTQAGTMWDAGITGAGIDVALIDTGVLPVNGLTVPGKVVNGADLSFESQNERLRYLDSNGHGTHLAGIIAGRDTGTPSRIAPGASKKYFLGMAPDARIVNVKVGDAAGAVDVSQVIAAIDWVVQHRRDPGLNIRVLNLAFGTDGTQSYLLDPLAFAVEVAWLRGLVVVVAAGNDGNSSPLRNPAFDPFVIAVGADASAGSYPVHDDTIPTWSNCGTAARSVDLVAPGQSIISLRAPGSNADLLFPNAREGERLFKGSGTSQAAAVVSGAAALLLQQRPDLTPDRLKALLRTSATPIPGASALCQGAGLIDLKRASGTPTPTSIQTWPQATGQGLIDGARGTARLAKDGIVLAGEKDIFGKAWNGPAWALASAAGSSWSGGSWNGSTWSGSSWSGSSWSGASWSGASWSGASWSGASWSGASWSDHVWSGSSWSGGSWSGSSWSGSSWSGHFWSIGSWE